MPACVGAAQCAYFGVGTERDVNKAGELLTKACDHGQGEACRLLADYGATGHPVSASENGTNPTLF